MAAMFCTLYRITQKIQNQQFITFFVHPAGLEPATTVPKTVVISISPRERGEIVPQLAQKQKFCYDLLQLRVWFSGRMTAFQAVDESSILSTRTNFNLYV